MSTYLHTCICGVETAVTVTPPKPARYYRGGAADPPEPASAWPECCPGCGEPIDADGALASAGEDSESDRADVGYDDGKDGCK